MTGDEPLGQIPPGADDAVIRWKLGHQAFHLNLAVMNTGLREARESLEDGRWPELVERLDRLGVLYDAATATMRYAADFSQELYEKLIRPSMAPPFVSPGFSGNLNLEHEQMLGRLRDLRRRLKEIERAGSAPAAVVEAATRLRTAQARNRRNHMFVCQQFVPDGASLLSEYFSSRKTNEDRQSNTVMEATQK
ncbi:hypothetical protein [Actinomadura rubrisoli]|uniref:Uncharacterized protein n=1 Tax=Actinomadura rubrisoli TaxID=2530368 RepID=A0A4R5AYP0_9ACTN|nr:hypothetical protein [Actinomadura rubrisoli]TDD77765.1 hypothetical protein E1298_29570 [Actinomadura rubrisoli]